ncbi:MAG: TRAP transporter fused permease subunit [Clostridia bacterium]|nr:TRAP transporter fused permease subunit [Clostridia bacterium]
MFFKKKTAEAAAEPMDLDAVMQKFDRESNVRIWEGAPKLVVRCILAFFALFCIYVTLFASWLEEIRLTSFVAFIILMGYLVYPAKKGRQRVNYMPWYDIVLMICGVGAFVYYLCNAYTIIGLGMKFEMYQIIIGVLGIISLAEVCRRSVGLPIVIVATCLIIYAFIWCSNPTFTGKLNYIVFNVFYSKEGIMSTPINVCSKFIVVFIIFGAFLERTGVADFFIKIANAVVGGFSGGPAKVAVVASALEGMVSGSSVANTVGSGSVTIPLMKKTGYKPEFAAAAEASASTGGQIMPPIMGAAAFLMAANLDVSYGSIVVKAILPAILYFAGVFICVHLEAKKEGLRGLSKDEIPKIVPLLKKTYLLIPLILLIYLVGTSQNSIQYAAALAILAAIIVGIINKENRITPKKIFEALAAGGQGMIAVAAACGVAGIIAGTITMTGLANTLFNGIIALAGDQVIVALFLTMLCCIVLGMGVPTTANYCIMAATCAPILVRMGVPDIAAHFFVFYFGIVADLTPPVALAAYAGAAIAQANPMKTAITSTKLAIGAFIVPYVFALNPAMLLIDTSAPEVVLIIITSMIGIFAVSASLEGYLLDHMPWYQRLISLCGGLCLIYPGVITDTIGLCCVGVVVLLQLMFRKNKAHLKN